MKEMLVVFTNGLRSDVAVTVTEQIERVAMVVRSYADARNKVYAMRVSGKFDEVRNTVNTFPGKNAVLSADDEPGYKRVIRSCSESAKGYVGPAYQSLREDVKQAREHVNTITKKAGGSTLEHELQERRYF